MNVFLTKTKMRANRTQLIAIAMCIIIAFSLFAFVGCTDDIEWLENDFFIYCYHTYSTGERAVIIGGITEKGKTQEYLVIPDEIDGYIVNEIFNAELNNSQYLIPYDAPLKKIYISKNVKSMERQWIAHSIMPAKRIYMRCVPQETAIIIDGLNVYASDIPQEDYCRALNWYFKGTNWSKDEIKSKLHVANLTYNYNYEGSPNRGIHFLDDLDEGERVIVKPPNPQRDGYKFDGWYLNSDCTEIFDLDTYERKSDDGLIVLFANWIKI